MFKEIEKNINSITKSKNDIQTYLKKMELIKDNISIYQNDEKNNYKKYYIDILGNLNNQLENKLNIIYLNLTGNNYIICEYDIKKDKLNQQIQILNSYEEVKRKDPKDWFWEYIKSIENEKEIKENCEIYLNNKRIDFCYQYKFGKENKNEIKIVSKTPLKSTNWMFFNCSSLTSLNLSNFNTNNVTNMVAMFCDCSSLTSLNLSNFNTNNVTNMEYMFYYCSSLISLNLSNFNTNNVTNMEYMFYKCFSLISLNLSNFNTNNVTNMGDMFYGVNRKKCKLICEKYRIVEEFD